MALRPDYLFSLHTSKKACRGFSRQAFFDGGAWLIYSAAVLRPDWEAATEFLPASVPAVAVTP